MDGNAAFAATVRIGTPLLFAGLGEVVLERSGLINIGIEGVMLAGAFSGFFASWYCHSPLLGALAGMLGGALIMLIFAALVLKFSADQIVTGMAINLIALGLTGTAWMRVSLTALDAPTFKTLSDTLPGWGSVPLIGPLFVAQTPLTWLALLSVLGVWYYLERSERGLELRAVGENPAAAEASGVNVLRCRWKACLGAGVLCGLGGAFLTISQTASFAPNCTKGRGFVALAAVVLGRYGAFGTALACLFFGAAFYARDALPSQSLAPDLIEMLPYAMTLIALCMKSQKRTAPAALGKPYTR